jgi:6-phosphofructokinase 1
MKRIGVLTSGGDAPGMNAAVRAVTRTAAAVGWEVVGIRDGYAGLLRGDMMRLGPRDVGGIIQQGGTFLGTARAPEFGTEEGQGKAVDVLQREHLDALVVIGGNGSQAGAHALYAQGFPVVGVASTIDNDLHGSDISIGVDTALNVALEAIDRLRVTAASHHRAFIVEVMGRDSGYLALMAGIAGGAEAVVIPEAESDPEELATELRAARERGKSHALVVVAEGAQYGAAAIVGHLEQHRNRLGFEARVTILGHVQRGGAPTAFDRLLATRSGAEAIDRLAAGEAGVLLGLVAGTIRATPLAEVVARPKLLDPRLIRLARVLAA